MRRWTAWATVLLSAGWCAPLLGAPAAPSPASPADVAAAQALFERGRALLASGLTREACPKFEESQRLEPALGTELNLASCYEQIGKLASAYALFTKVAAAAGSAGQQQRAAVARTRAEALRPRLTRLAIQMPAGASGRLRVERDGVPLGEAQWGFPVPVDPGPHRVRVTGEGVREWTRELDLPADGAVHRVDVPPPSSDSASFFSSVNHRWAVAAAGVGVVGLAAAGVFTARALDQKQASDDAGCRRNWCPTPEGVALRNSASRAGNLATLGAGVGVAGLGAAAALLWLLPEPERGTREQGAANLRLTPVAAPGSGAVLVSAQF